MSFDKVVIRKSWRSESISLLLVVILGFFSNQLSTLVPFMSMKIELFNAFGETTYLMVSPIWLIPIGIFLKVVIARYDVRYVLDEKGIEARVGIMSVTQRVNRIRYEDIRGVNSKQTVLGRILNYGTVEIDTPATEGVEIIMKGVASPAMIKEVVLNEQNVREEAPLAATSA